MSCSNPVGAGTRTKGMRLGSTPAHRGEITTILILVLATLVLAVLPITG